MIDVNQGKNIFELEKKKHIYKKILSIIGIIIFGGLLFLGISYYFNNQKKIIANSIMIDEYFIGFTAKNVETFENPILNKSIYSNNDNACGYFYKNTPLAFNEIDDKIKILSTIDFMFTCYNMNPNKKGCGISYNSNTKKYNTVQNEVKKYMKLLYGPNVQYEDQSVTMEYNQIKNLDYINDKYQFEKQIVSDANVIEKYDYLVISKNIENENEIIIIKSIAYFEETINNGVKQIDVYRFDDKKDKLSTLLNNKKETINDFLKTSEAPLYKITFNRHPDDGRYIFKSIEPFENKN